jgi:hypothetical protein
MINNTAIIVYWLSLKPMRLTYPRLKARQLSGELCKTIAMEGDYRELTAEN